MANENENGTALADKEVAALGQSENKTPATTSTGEYSEEKKAVLGALKSHFGEDVSPDDGEYTSKLESMVATDLIPKSQTLKSYDDANTRMSAMMDDEPILGDILMDVGKGSKFLSAVKRHVDIASIPEDTDEADWEANAKTREDNYKTAQNRKAEIAANEEKSMETIEKFVNDKELNGDDAVAFGKIVADFLDRAYSGDITEQFLETMFYHMNRDKDMGNQFALGELKGKNAKIANEQFKASDYEGDGLPSINGGGANSEDFGAGGPTDPMVERLNKHLDASKSIIQR